MSRDVIHGDGYTLICGDCLDVLPTLQTGSVDAVITDPPYGINFINGGGHSSTHGWREQLYIGNWDKTRPSKKIFNLIFSLNKKIIIWGGNYFTDYLPPSQQWLIWDKGQRDFSLADFEMAWSSQDRAGRIFDYPRARMLQENGLHPTQKPVALMEWCIELITQPGDTILDPFMGSGTTGVAAMLTGRRFVGVELDRGYFDIAHRRIEDAARTARREWKPLQDTAKHDDLPLFAKGGLASATSNDGAGRTASSTDAGV